VSDNPHLTAISGAQNDQFQATLEYLEGKYNSQPTALNLDIEAPDGHEEFGSLAFEMSAKKPQWGRLVF